MNYNKILKLILQHKLAKWWRNYPPEFSAYKERISTEILKSYLEKVFERQNSDGVGLYIHIPFCSSRCHFCKYYSEVIKDEGIMSEYIKCIEKELSFYKINFKNHFLQSIYFGGGTPTLLDGKNWSKLFKIIHNFFKIDKNAQILVEGTPETCTPQKLKLLKDLGVNRLTIGTQTFDEKILNSLNRKHSIQDIYKAFENARKAGIKYLNMDLLFGLPGETKRSFLKTLKRAVEIKPESISPAFFDFHERASFSKSFSKKDFRNVYVNPYQPKTEAEAFSEIRRILEKENYYAEVDGRYYSSFLLEKGIEASNQNNIPKGLLDSTVVIGCHADGYLNYFESASEKRFRQLQYHGVRLNQYIYQLRKGKMPIFSGMELPEDELIRQYLIYCFIFLRGRINKKDFSSRFNKEVIPVLKSNFSGLLKDYKIKENEDVVYFQRHNPYFYVNRDKFVLFCIKYLYSPKVLKDLMEKVKNESLHL